MIFLANMAAFDRFASKKDRLKIRGIQGDKKGTAFVVYDDIFDAKNAVDHLSGFNVAGRYLVVLYYQPHKMLQKKAENAQS
jgi:RNA recognition motif-containing protein